MEKNRYKWHLISIGSSLLGFACCLIVLNGSYSSSLRTSCFISISVLLTSVIIEIFLDLLKTPINIIISIIAIMHNLIFFVSCIICANSLEYYISNLSYIAVLWIDLIVGFIFIRKKTFIYTIIILSISLIPILFYNYTLDNLISIAFILITIGISFLIQSHYNMTDKQKNIENIKRLIPKLIEIAKNKEKTKKIFPPDGQISFNENCVIEHKNTRYFYFNTSDGDTKVILF